MRARSPEFDSEPNWKPLELVIQPDHLADYMHMGRVGTIQLYKNRNTRQYLNIDSESGEFFALVDGEYIRTTRDWAIALAYHRCP